jgi:hypothetical protein
MCYYDVIALNGGVFSQKATQRYNDSNVFASLVDVIFRNQISITRIFEVTWSNVIKIARTF